MCIMIHTLTSHRRVGKAYAISDVIQASYFYPLEPDGLKGEITPYRRALKDGEVMEWVLLSGVSVDGRVVTVS